MFRHSWTPCGRQRSLLGQHLYCVGFPGRPVLVGIPGHECVQLPEPSRTLRNNVEELWVRDLDPPLMAVFPLCLESRLSLILRNLPGGESLPPSRQIGGDDSGHANNRCTCGAGPVPCHTSMVSYHSKATTGASRRGLVVAGGQSPREAASGGHADR
jgi:hypothetical protein